MKRTLMLGVGLLAVLSLAACSNPIGFDVLDEPQTADDLLPDGLGDIAGGLDPDLVRFLAEDDGIVFYLGVNAEDSDSRCLVVAPQEGMPTTASTYCGAGTWLGGGAGEIQFQLVADDYLGDIDGYRRIHPNLFVAD